MNKPAPHLAVYQALNLTDIQLDVLLRMLRMRPEADGWGVTPLSELLAALAPDGHDDERLDALKAVLDVLASKVHSIEANAHRKVSFVLLTGYSFDDDWRELKFQINPSARALLQPVQP